MLALDVFVNNILPIFLVAGLGFALRRVWQLDKQVVSRVVFYALSPCLLFDSLVNAAVTPQELLRLAGFALVSILLMGLVAWGLGRVMRFGATESAALVLAVMFSNAGNYGLPLNQLRYGDAGLTHAIPYVIVSGILVYTLGVLVASAGRQPWRKALSGLRRLPIIYATTAALIIYAFRIDLPPFLGRGIKLAADGALPVMLLVLGMQMADLRRLTSWRLTLPAVGLRLLVGPLVGIATSLGLGLSGQGRASSLLEASMPVAVATTILATEYDLHPEAIAGMVVLSTLLSPLTVTLVIRAFGL